MSGVPEQLLIAGTQSIQGVRQLRINELWLLRLRWVAVIGQLLTIGVAWVGGTDLLWPPLLAVIGFTAATNLLFALWLRSQPSDSLTESDRDYRILFSLMALDLLALTSLLYLSGGPSNPFSVFYFVNLALAAVLLPARAGWLLTVMAVVCLASLFAGHVPLPELNRPVPGLPGSNLTLQQLGRMLAFAGSATVLCYFITRVTGELQLRNADLRIAEQQRARSAKLESLATLAAGAGHELASPLSTIAVIANDLSRHLEETQVPDSVIEDVRLIRGELEHCRKVLDGLTSSAGQVSGEQLLPLSVAALAQEIVDGIRRRERVRVVISPDDSDTRLVVPKIGTAQAIRGVVRNALDASAADQTVNLRIRHLDNWVQFEVQDKGTGMNDDVLARVGEPFFSTKEPGQGMGLGIFLTRNVLDRLGGEMQFESSPGRGTLVTIRLPLPLDPDDCPV